MTGSPDIFAALGTIIKMWDFMGFEGSLECGRHQRKQQGEDGQS